MRMYTDIAALVSLFSVVGIFAMFYIKQLNDNHLRQKQQDSFYRNIDQLWEKMTNLEDRLNDKIDNLSDNVANSMDSRPRTRKVTK